MRFLQEIYDSGVRNIEMESLYLAAFCNELGIKSAMVATTLLDRLQGDQVVTSKATMNEWCVRPQKLVLRYVKRYMDAKLERENAAAAAAPAAME